MTLLLRMIAGSRLYGTNRVDSDYDWYEIYDHCKPFHSAHGPDGDITRWPLSMFMKIADKGGHNALDLMFASHDWCEVDLLKNFRNSYYANPYNCYHRFNSTINALLEQDTNKSRLHAERMRDNLDDIMKFGRYNPRWREPHVEDDE